MKQMREPETFLLGPLFSFAPFHHFTQLVLALSARSRIHVAFKLYMFRFVSFRKLFHKFYQINVSILFFVYSFQHSAVLSNSIKCEFSLIGHLLGALLHTYTVVCNSLNDDEGCFDCGISEGKNMYIEREEQNRKPVSEEHVCAQCSS